MNIDPTIYTTPPTDQRSPQETDCYALLEQLAIPYERLDHDPANSVEDGAVVGPILGIHIYKNLFLCNRKKTKFYLLVMPSEKPFQTKQLSSQLQISRLSFADKEHMESYLHTMPGSVSVLGLQYDTDHQVQLLIDRDVLENPYFGCHPCKNTTSLKISLSDLFRRFLPHIGHTPIFVTL